MVEEVLKQVKIDSATWKAFLLAGVLPSGVLILGANGYVKGWGGVRTTLQQSIASWKSFVESVSLMVLAGLAIALTFYAARHLILGFFQNLSKPVPKRLRDWRVRVNQEEELNCRTEVQKALWRITVARWHERGFEFGEFVHPLVREAVLSLPTREELLRNCERVRATIRACRRMLDEVQQQEVLAVLCPLHLLAADRGRVGERAYNIFMAHGAPQGTAKADWFEAEQQLGISAAGDWLGRELALWKNLVGQSANATEVFDAVADDVQHDYARAYARQRAFPSRPWLQPTRIGNIFAALDDYSCTRYGMDTATLWSRLQTILPERHREEVRSGQLSIETFLNLTVAFALLGVVSLVLMFSSAAKITGTLLFGKYEWARWRMAGPILGQTSKEKWWVAIFVMASAALAVLSYSAAIYAAGFVRERIEAMVDVHVLRWLRYLGFAPKDVGERAKLLERLGLFFGGGSQLPSDFPLLPASEPGTEDEKRNKYPNEYSPVPS